MLEKFIELQRYSGNARTEALKRLQYNTQGEYDKAFLLALRNLLDKNVTTNCKVKAFDNQLLKYTPKRMTSEELMNIADIRIPLTHAINIYATLNNNGKHEEAEIYKALYTKTLKIGLTAKSVNKALGREIVPNLGCLLAKRLVDQDPSKLVGKKWTITEKLDGHRKIVAINEESIVTIYSGRNGLIDNEYPELHGIIREYLNLGILKPDRAYDGELIAIGKFDNSIVQRQATSSICQRKGPKAGVGFAIFDMIRHSDFIKGKCLIPYKNRRIALNKLGDQIGFYDSGKDSIGQLLSVVPTLGATEMPLNLDGTGLGAIAKAFTTMLWSQGKEGIMLNSEEGLWENTRSGDILKVKKVEDIDLEVVGMEPGSATGKYSATLGSLHVAYKGNIVSVGSGLSDAQRDFYWANPGTIIGKVITVAHLGESKNKNGEVSLNAPTFVDIRLDKGADE